MAGQFQQRRGRSRGGPSREREVKEFEQKVLEVARVTRVTAGGKRMRFRVLAVIGDLKGRVGFAVAKGSDVSQAITKATTRAKKNLITIVTVNDTIPHAVTMKHGASRLILKPAPRGTGIIAGGVVRPIFELSGVGNVVSKLLGTRNKINNVTATFKALQMLRTQSPSRKPRVKEAPVQAQQQPQ